VFDDFPHLLRLVGSALVSLPRDHPNDTTGQIRRPLRDRLSLVENEELNRQFKTQWTLE
jgi:hypothetical protein